MQHAHQPALGAPLQPAQRASSFILSSIFPRSRCLVLFDTEFPTRAWLASGQALPLRGSRISGSWSQPDGLLTEFGCGLAGSAQVVATPAAAHQSQPGSGTTKGQSRQWGARSVDVFQSVEQIGEGQYGQVWLAREQEGDKTVMVALKKIKMDNEKEGFPITAIREIKILKNLRHPNIVRLREIVTSKASDNNKQKGSVYMVFEYADHDLMGLLLSPRVRLEKPHIKRYMKQLLEGLHYLHTQKILHRDIKGANLLITKEGDIKIADFGLARSYNDPTVALTKKVITLWYRPPEVLLESDKYGAPADIWSVGCIFAELLLKHSTGQYRNVWSLPNGEGGPHNETEQINKIFDVCGTPTRESWPGHDQLPGMKNLKFKPKPTTLAALMREQCKSLDEATELPFCQAMLTCNPDKRLTAKEALDHDYFWKPPLAAESHEMPRLGEACHEWQVKQRGRREKRENQAGHQHPPHQGGPIGVARPAHVPPSNKMPRAGH